MTWNGIQRVFFAPRYDSGGKFTILLSIILAFLIVDMSFSYSATIISLSSSWETALFIVIAVIYGIGQYSILELLKRKSIDITRKVRELYILDKVVTIFQYVITANIILIVLQVVITSHYSTSILSWSSTISYALASIVTGILAQRFFLWYGMVRNFVIMLYGLSSAVICIAMMLLLTFGTASFITLPSARNSQSQATFPFYDQSTPMGILQYTSAVADAISTLLLWVSTVVFLHHYSQKIGRIKFWIVMSIPVISLVIQYVIISPIIQGIQPSPDKLFLVTFGNMLPGISAGILFGVPFWIVARTLHRNIITDYMIVAGWGLVLFNVTTSAGVTHAPYPPFGLASVLLTGLACYLVLKGIYFSAISLSLDIRLRQEIRKSAVDQSKLLDSIGIAHMEDEIQGRIISVAKRQANNLANESGIQASLTDDEMRTYLDEVLIEINKSKKG